METIGNLIKELRTRRGMTQAEFADALSTSQSAIARIESGDQNLTMEQVSKISEALEHPIVSVSQNESDDFTITGGAKLSGSIKTNASKNGAMGLLCAALLNRGTTILHNIPQIEEVHRLIEIFESIGIKVRWTEEYTVEIIPPASFHMEHLDTAAATKIRSSLMMIGALIHHMPTFNLPHSGGCSMGERTIAAHRLGLANLGVTVTTHEDHYEIVSKGRHAGEVTMYEASDTGTENILIAAALLPGKTTIHFAQENYMVQDVMGFLRACGVTIERESVTTIHVMGVPEIDQTIEYWNSEDPIESFAFITAGIVTKSTITVTRCPIDFLRLELYKLETMGQKFDISAPYMSQNGFTKLVDITIIPSNLVAPTDKIHPLPYPGINVDNLPFFVLIATQAEGTTLIHDWMWENRAIYFTELNKLGASVILADPHRVFVHGPTPLRAAEIFCPPALRPSVLIMLAMLVAPGTSTLRNVYAIKRGYEHIDERLNSLGASVTPNVSIT